MPNMDFSVPRRTLPVFIAFQICDETINKITKDFIDQIISCYDDKSENSADFGVKFYLISFNEDFAVVSESNKLLEKKEIDIDFFFPEEAELLSSENVYSRLNAKMTHSKIFTSKIGYYPPIFYWFTGENHPKERFNGMHISRESIISPTDSKEVFLCNQISEQDTSEEDENISYYSELIRNGWYRISHKCFFQYDQNHPGYQYQESTFVINKYLDSATIKRIVALLPGIATEYINPTQQSMVWSSRIAYDDTDFDERVIECHPRSNLIQHIIDETEERHHKDIQRSDENCDSVADKTDKNLSQNEFSDKNCNEANPEDNAQS